MEDIHNTFNARKTILEMLIDRNYIVNKEYLDLDLDTFQYLYDKKDIDMLCDHKSGLKKIYVKFTYITKIKPNNIRDYANKIITTYLHSTNDELLIILKNKPNNSIIKKESEYRICEFFWLDILQLNITKHVLVPKHSLITVEEIEKLLKKYNLKSIHQLPVIFRNDPVIRYYNFKPNSVCKIIRPSETSIKYIYYRFIK